MFGEKLNDVLAHAGFGKSSFSKGGQEVFVCVCACEYVQVQHHHTEGFEPIREGTKLFKAERKTTSHLSLSVRG